MLEFFQLEFFGLEFFSKCPKKPGLEVAFMPVGPDIDLKGECLKRSENDFLYEPTQYQLTVTPRETGKYVTEVRIGHAFVK